MKKPEKTSSGQNYRAIDLGAIDNLSEYALVHPVSGQKIEGKIFLKEHTGSTGTEISFQVLPPNTALSYFHKHIQNEETYIVIKGKGLFQVDDDCFEISEGSIVTVSPDGARCLCNTGDSPMTYMVIQSKAGSLEQYSSEDGERIEKTACWEKS